MKPARYLLTAALLVLGIVAAANAESGTAREGVVTLAPHITETVFALGQGRRVIAVSSFCDYPPEIARLPKVGAHIDPDFEKLTLLNPELLILAGKHQKVTEFARMRKLPVLNVHMDSFETIDAGIAAIGKELDCEREADALRARIRSEIEAVREAVKKLPRPKVLIITIRQDHNLNSLYTANRRSFVSEIVDCAGGANIYADGKSVYMEASKESVVLRAPEVILEFHAGQKLDADERAEYVADWRQLPSLPAVKNNRVCLVTESHSLRPGPRVGEIARIVARLLHPEAKIPEP